MERVQSLDSYWCLRFMLVYGMLEMILCLTKIGHTFFCRLFVRLLTRLNFGPTFS
jgi:hypothetical protein